MAWILRNSWPPAGKHLPRRGLSVSLQGHTGAFVITSQGCLGDFRYCSIAGSGLPDKDDLMRKGNTTKQICVLEIHRTRYHSGGSEKS